MTKNEIIVCARKYDGVIHREWTARLRHRANSLLVLDAEFDSEIRHPLLGTIERGTQSVEYYWTDRWYNVFRFLNSSGALRNYYCNVNAPAQFENGVLSFVDLDFDILVAPDYAYRVLDEDEFEANARRYNYPADVKRKARGALRELIEMIEDRRFPFAADEDS